MALLDDVEPGNGSGLADGQGHKYAIGDTCPQFGDYPGGFGRGTPASGAGCIEKIGFATGQFSGDSENTGEGHGRWWSAGPGSLDYTGDGEPRSVDLERAKKLRIFPPTKEEEMKNLDKR